MDKIQFTIPINPTTKKNNMTPAWVHGRLKILPSKKYREYEKAAKPYCVGLVEKPIDYPVNVKAVYFIQKRYKYDLCNLHECLCDVLKTYGVVRDDNFKIIYSMDGSAVDYDKDNPRTEVEIVPLELNETKLIHLGIKKKEPKKRRNTQNG